MVKKECINPSMLFIGFYLLMEEEKASGKRKNLLYKKVLGKTLESEQFKALYEQFRKAFETKDVRFHDTYQWFEGDNLVVFAGSPNQYEKRNRCFKAIEPKFIIKENKLIVKLDIGQADVAGTDGSFFYVSQCCYPFNLWEFSIEKISKSKRYAQRLLNATKTALESFEMTDGESSKKKVQAHAIACAYFYL